MSNKKTIEITFDEITANVEIPEKKNRMHENHLGNATVILSDSRGHHIAISGFTIWESKYENGGNVVQVPQRGKNWKFWFSDQGTLNDVTQLILDEYEIEQIPIV